MDSATPASCARWEPRRSLRYSKDAMTTTIFEAKPYDEARARRRRIWISSIIIAVLVIGFLLWWFRFWPVERRVDRFFGALQSQNYEQAYGIWMNDENWKQHPAKY